MSVSKLDSPQVIKTVFDDVNDALKVNIVAGIAAITIDSEIVDDSAFTPGTSEVIMVGATFDDTTPDSVDEGDGGAIRMSANRNVYTTLRDAAGNERGVNVTVGNALTVDASATTQPISAASLPLPSGAATEASLTSIDGKVVACDTGAVVVSSSALPSGASTAAKQPALGTAGLASTDVISVQGIASMTALTVDGSAVTQPVSVASLPLPTGASTEATLSTLNGKVTACDTGAVVVSSSALPTGAATEASLASVDGKITACNTGAVVISNGAAASAVNIQDGGNSITVDGTVAVTLPITPGFTNSEFVRNDYSSVNVTTGAYVELIASTAADYQEFEIFDSSGQTLKIAFGALASEVDKFIVFPGGNGRITRNVASGTRISIKAISATASVGEICINLYG